MLWRFGSFLANSFGSVVIFTVLTDLGSLIQFPTLCRLWVQLKTQSLSVSSLQNNDIQVSLKLSLRPPKKIENQFKYIFWIIGNLRLLKNVQIENNVNYLESKEELESCIASIKLFFSGIQHNTSIFIVEHESKVFNQCPWTFLARRSNPIFRFIGQRFVTQCKTAGTKDTGNIQLTRVSATD